jgi:hypothetical protein
MKILKMMDSDRGHSDRLYPSLRRFCLSLRRRDLLASLDEVIVKDTACKESSHRKLQVSERERETEEEWLFSSLCQWLSLLSLCSHHHSQGEGGALSRSPGEAERHRGSGREGGRVGKREGEGEGEGEGGGEGPRGKKGETRQ